ncbi:tryptophan synthase subunit alpha [Methylophilus luteus]|jgi:tryptophan synthase alpha chain|uniref:Tryptophan synthase alpha chain n=1 Tax=Methylophilus luteus TaxID=640108 RepID=A0ABW3F281_9PROT
MSRIQSVFAELKAQGKKALIPYITAGDPNPEQTVPLLHALVASGADVIELGVPFSDPMADGPVIQRASERALVHKMGLRKVLAMVRDFRETNQTTPIVLMGYANPIEAMGAAQFVELAKDAGVDGVLTVDYPPEECEDFNQQLAQAGIDSIFLLSPTTEPARTELIVKQATGFLYYVSLKGVTGAGNLDIVEVKKRVTEIRNSTSLPIGVGFGVKDAATAREVSVIADAVVVGSRMVLAIEQSDADNLIPNVQALMKELRTAIDSV